LLLCVAGLLAPGRVSADDIRSVVREHMTQELEQEPKPKPQPRAQPAPAPAPTPPPQPPPSGGTTYSFSTEDPAAPPDPAAPELPVRVLGKYLQLDVKLGGGYRGWLPQQFPSVPVKVGSYYVWTVDVQAKLFKFLNLHRGYYETNSLSGPTTHEAAVAEQVGSYIPKAAWLLGVLGFPFLKVWEPVIRYESRAFQTEARPETPVCVVTDAVARDLDACPRSAARLKMRSSFETLSFGIRYDRSKDNSAVLSNQPRDKLPPITFGIGLMSYRKPYQVNVNGNTLDGYLFDGRFRGAGAMLGVDVKGGPDRLLFRLDAQLGLGQVRLTDKLTLNTLTPDGWLMGYLQGNVTLGYYLPLYRKVPTLMFVPQATLGGASFFLFDTKQRENRNQAASVNWDLLWSVHAALSLSL
jgi:hypothetical protein